MEAELLKAVREIVQKRVDEIATEEIAAAKERIEQRVMRDTAEMACTVAERLSVARFDKELAIHIKWK